MWSRAFRVLELAVRLETDDDRVAEILGPMTATYEPAAEAECSLRYRLLARPEPVLVIDGRAAEHPAQWLELAPRFELDLYEQVMARTPDAWFLHAAAVATERGAVVLAGAPEAGKSTLSLALCARGLRYMADEMVAVDAGLAVRGVTRPIAFTNDQPAELPEGFGRASYRFPGPLGVHRALLAQPPPDRLGWSPQPVHRVIVLAREPEGPAVTERLSAGEAMGLLWEQTLRKDELALSRAADLLDRVTAVRLRSSSPDGACEAILKLSE